MEFNRAYRCYAEQRWAYDFHRREEWMEATQETDYLYCCWDWLHAAQRGEGRDAWYWMKSFRRVRQLIGEDAYQRGVMPPAVPVWRFQVVGAP